MKNYCLKKVLSICKFLAFALSVVILLTTASPLTMVEAVEEESSYAEIILSESPQTHNCVHYDDGLEEVVMEGRTGLITNTAEEKFHIYMDIADDFMYDIPEGVAVDVTIEYYDEVKGRAFCLMYDSHNPSPKLTNNNTFWGVSEMVTCLGSGEWKSYTFRLTDLRAINRTNNQADLRVQTWIAGTGEKRGDIVFGKMRVEYGKYDSYMELTSATSEYAGNTFSIDDETIKMSFNLKNRAENDDVTGTVSYKVYDKDKKLCFEDSFTENVQQNATKTVDIEFDNPGKNGLYTIDYVIDSECASDSSKATHFEGELWFAVMDDFKTGEQGNVFMGINQQIGMKQRGDRKAVAELAARAGFTYLRDDRPKTDYRDGKWYVDDEYKEMYRMLKSYGIEPVLIIDVPYDGTTWPATGVTWSTNNPPDTDAEIASYAQYCGDVVSDLKGLVQYFEIFNEYNINIKNGVASASAENYAKMVQAASAEMKLANPDCTIIGIAAAGSTADGTDRGIDTQFTSGVFENGGFDGLDAVSAHPYDFRQTFGTDRFINDATVLQGLVNSYGGGKELWATEFGWGTANSGTNQSYTREEQVLHTVMQAALARSYGLYEPMLYYCLMDMENRYEQEHNWGLLHEWTRTDGNAYTAKESYIAMAAFNKLLGTDSEPKGVIEDAEAYALWYTNNALDKDIILLAAVAEERTISIDLGTNSIELYDVYGNSVTTLESDNGVYDFTASAEPVYLIGNIQNFTKTDIDINFDDCEDGTINPYGIKGTVTTLDGNKVLKLSEDVLTYIDTGIDQEDTGKYELSFSMRPDTKLDEYLFSFDGVEPYYSNYTFYRLAFFTTPNNGHLHGWYQNSGEWSSTYNHNRLKVGYKTGVWYNFKAVFDMTARTVDVNVSGEALGLNSYSYTINLPEGAYPKRFKIQTVDKNENSADAVCYLDNLSFKRASYEDIDIDFESYADEFENPDGIKGTVTTIDGNKVLKLSEDALSYIDTEIPSTDVGMYELKFSVRPKSINDEYLFAFDGVSPYYGDNSSYRLALFATPNSGQLNGWHEAADEWSTADDHNLLVKNLSSLNGTWKTTWFNITAVFDLEARVVDVNIESVSKPLFGQTQTSVYTYTIDLPEGAYPKRFKIQTVNKNENSADAVFYVDNISLKALSGYALVTDGLYKADETTKVTALDEFVKGDEVVFKLKYSNLTDETRTINCIIGYYSEEGSLVSIDIADEQKLLKQTKGEKIVRFTVPDMTSVADVRLFIWRSLSNPIPEKPVYFPFAEQ